LAPLREHPKLTPHQRLEKLVAFMRSLEHDALAVIESGGRIQRMRTLLGCLMIAALAVVVRAQEPVDTAMVAKIRAEGLERSQVHDLFHELTDVIGPRLTNSPAHKRSIAWTQERLKAWGLANVHSDPFEFGRGWTLEKLVLEMTAPRYMPLIGYPQGWSPSTTGVIAATPVWLPNPTKEQLAAKAGQLRGAIVMTSPIQDYFIRADRPPASGDLRSDRPRTQPHIPAGELAAALRREGVGAVLQPNIGEHGTIFVTGRDQGEDAIPTIVLASEHYNLIARLLQQNVPVTLAVQVQARYDETDGNAHNVIAEIPGVDPRIGSEVVMAGAHLDSWHSATGATDNADGIATVMEAVRILKALGVRPRRTIRIALWAGEEQGLLGSRAYVEKHLAGDRNAAAREKFSVYFNFDNGFPPITGLYMQGNERGKPIVDAWLAPLKHLGVTQTTIGSIGSTDHLSFTRVGLPGFQAVQSYEGYDVRTHHTNADFVERIEPQALKQASVVIATLLYHAAMRDERFPRGSTATSAPPE
jgi:carboxypeptidase Q